MNTKQTCYTKETKFQKYLAKAKVLIQEDPTLHKDLQEILNSFYLKLTFIVAISLIAIFFSYYEVASKTKELEQSVCIECNFDESSQMFRLFFKSDEIKLIDGFVVSNSAKIAIQNCKSIDERLCKGVSDASK